MDAIYSHFKDEYSKKWIKMLLRHKKKIIIYHILENKNLTMVQLVKLQQFKKKIFSNKHFFTCSALCGNPNLIIENLNIFNSILWDWNKISCNSNITMKYISENMHYPWNWSLISENPNLTIEFVSENFHEKWNWMKISKNPNITMKNINEHFNYPWVWNSVSENPNLTIEMIKNNIDKCWNIRHISKTLNINDIKQNKKLSIFNDLFYTSSILENPTLTIQMIMNNKRKICNWYSVCENINITPEMIYDNSYIFNKLKPSHIYSISKNPNLTCEFILKNLNYSWNWNFISSSAKLTIKFILDNPKLPWSWGNICKNNFDYDRTKSIKYKTKLILLTKILNSKNKNKL